MQYRSVILPVVAGILASCGHGGGKLNDLMASNRFDALLVEADACLAKTPQSIECREARAHALEGLGRRGAAAEAWRAVLETAPTHATAWEHLIHAVDRLPAPSFGLDLIGSFTPDSVLLPPDRREVWAARASQADSLLTSGIALGESAEWERGVESLRHALRIDGGRLEIRRALCTALRGAHTRGETSTERISPLDEAIRVCNDEGLMPGIGAQLRDVLSDATTLLGQERAALAAASTYKPWPGARFNARVDTSSFYPRIQFRCDETKWADITVDFEAQHAQYTMVGERMPLLQYPRSTSPSLGTVVGSAKTAPSVVVLAELGDYRLVSVGGLRGWVSSGAVAVKHRFTAEIKPRGSLELRVRPAMAHIRIDVEGMNVFRGDVELKPYLVYNWSF